MFDGDGCRKKVKVNSQKKFNPLDDFKMLLNELFQTVSHLNEAISKATTATQKQI